MPLRRSKEKDLEIKVDKKGNIFNGKFLESGTLHDVWGHEVLGKAQGT